MQQTTRRHLLIVQHTYVPLFYFLHMILCPLVRSRSVMHGYSKHYAMIMLLCEETEILTGQEPGGQHAL
jgi:hypothetical protein